jgi:hypothetical protein
VSGAKLIPTSPEIAPRIFTIRGAKVIVSIHLAELYGVPHKALMQAVRRNSKRFPSDFVFQLSRQEFNNLKSQIVTSKTVGRGGLRKMPSAFTEHGALMAANVLKSTRAAEVSVEIVRAFVKLRRFALTNRELARKVAELEKRYDGQFEQVFEALRHLLAAPEPSHSRKIGFTRPGD